MITIGIYTKSTVMHCWRDDGTKKITICGKHMQPHIVNDQPVLSGVMCKACSKIIAADIAQIQQ